MDECENCKSENKQCDANALHIKEVRPARLQAAVSNRITVCFNKEPEDMKCELVSS